jgi:hypothetical protein
LRPAATPFTRTLLETSRSVVSLHHETLRLDDELSSQLLLLLDGTRDRAQLLAELQEWARQRGRADPGLVTEELLEKTLRGLHACGLLIA